MLRLLGPGPTWLRWMFFPLHFELVVDGIVASDVWPGVVATAEVTPGAHNVHLRRPYARFLKSTDLEVTVEPGQTVELSFADLLSYLFSGVPNVNLATPEEAARIQHRIGRLPPP